MSLTRLVYFTLTILLLVGTLLPVAPAHAQATATLHYHRPGGDYDGWGLHVWGAAAQETLWTEPLAPAGSDAFGVFWEVPLRADADELGFIIHNGDAKDPGPDCPPTCRRNRSRERRRAPSAFPATTRRSCAAPTGSQPTQRCRAATPTATAYGR